MKLPARYPTLGTAVCWDLNVGNGATISNIAAPAIGHELPLVTGIILKADRCVFGHSNSPERMMLERRCLSSRMNERTGIDTN